MLPQQWDAAVLGPSHGKPDLWSYEAKRCQTHGIGSAAQQSPTCLSSLPNQIQMKAQSSVRWHHFLSHIGLLPQGLHIFRHKAYLYCMFVSFHRGRLWSNRKIYSKIFNISIFSELLSPDSCSSPLNFFEITQNYGIPLNKATEITNMVTWMSHPHITHLYFPFDKNS